MGLLAAWLLYPLVLVAICLGLGLLVARLSAWDLPRPLLVGVGLATLLALARLITATEPTAPLALPIVLVLAVAGYATGRHRLRGPVDRWAVVGAVAVFAVFAAPTALSGEPTFAGYTSLPDTSHQLALAEQYAAHGPHYQDVPDGSYRLALAKYIGTAYPVAGQAALGVTAPLGVLDIAWLYQTFLAFLCATAFGSVLVLVRPYVRARWLRVLVAFVAVQPALLVSFLNQGSIKELGAATMLLLAVTLVAEAARAGQPARSLLPLAVAGAAAFGALGPAVGPYLVIVAAVALGVWLVRARRAGGRADVAWLAACGLVAVVLSLPMLASLRTAVVVNSGTLDNAGDLGHLAGPLRPIQAFGIWLNGDFRYAPAGHRWLAYALVAVAIAAAVLGVVSLIRRRAFGPLLFVGVMVVPSLYLLRKGSPYADAKVLMLMSTALLLAALLGAAALFDRRRVRVVGAGLAGLLALGVLGSNALAYHDVSLAPHDRYAELLDVNGRLAGKGPTISTEYDEFGEYFLRDTGVRSQPEYPHGYRDAPYAPNALQDAQRRPSLKTPLDPDDLTLKYVQSAEHIVVRRSPTASRPPANFRLASRGRWYDVWERTPGPRVLEHVPLGLTALSAGDTPRCADVRAVARRAARVGARLAYVERPQAPTLMLSALPLRGRWYQYGAFPGAVVPNGPGSVTGGLRVAADGEYVVWLQGSFGRTARVKVDGREIGALGDRLNNPGNWESVAKLRLTRGPHRIEILQGGGTLAPGTGGYWASLRNLGPLVLSGAENEAKAVRTVAPEAWRELCGRRLDWIEVVDG